MSYDEFKKLCRESWEEDCIYLCSDGSQKKEPGRNCICIESKKTFIEATPQTKAF